MAATAVSSAKVALVDSGEVGRSAAYNNDPRTLPWGTLALTGEYYVCLASVFTMILLQGNESEGETVLTCT
jgi:hypothetical protein